MLPLIEMKSLLFGHFFVSLPFVNYGGVLADAREFEEALLRAAVQVAKASGARHIELRQSSPSGSAAEDGWALRQHKAALVVKLQPDTEALWSGLSSRLRGKVRKSEKGGAVFSVEAAEGLRDFYSVFSLNMRNLGTPVYGAHFFQNVLRLSADSAVLLVRRGGKPVAGAIALRSGDRIELPWICSDYSERAEYVNEFLYWRAIEWACASGARELDLGRSSIDAGTYRFKLQWNPEIQPLYWYYWPGRADDLPKLSPENPKYMLAIDLWKKMPLSLANRLGPWIIRSIP